LLSSDKSVLFVYLTEVSSGFFKSFDSITLYYLFWNLFQNGCQFNMSRNVFFLFFAWPTLLKVSLKAGAKVQLLFLSRKCFEKFFLENFRFFFLFNQTWFLNVYTHSIFLRTCSLSGRQR